MGWNYHAQLHLRQFCNVVPKYFCNISRPLQYSPSWRNQSLTKCKVVQNSFLVVFLAPTMISVFAFVMRVSLWTLCILTLQKLSNKLSNSINKIFVEIHTWHRLWRVEGRQGTVSRLEPSACWCGLVRLFVIINIKFGKSNFTIGRLPFDILQDKTKESKVTPRH